MLTPTKRQSWHFKRGILKERDLLKKRQSAKLILVPGQFAHLGVLIVQKTDATEKYSLLM